MLVRPALTTSFLVIAALGHTSAPASSVNSKRSWGELRSEIRAVIGEAWQQRERDGRATTPRISGFQSWTEQMSPPFPATWPPDGQGRLIVYAYAYGHS